MKYFVQAREQCRSRWDYGTGAGFYRIALAPTAIRDQPGVRSEVVVCCASALGAQTEPRQTKIQWTADGLFLSLPPLRWPRRRPRR